MATSTIPRHYARILSQWPKDLVRPTVQFQDVLRLKIPSEASKVESQPAPSKDLRDPSRPAVSETKPVKASDPQAELRNINALYTLLDDRYAKKFPIPKSLLQPSGNEDYYDKLMADFAAAPNKTWTTRMMETIRGKFRWS